MQRASLLCSPHPVLPLPASASTSHVLAIPWRNPIFSLSASPSSSSALRLHCARLQFHLPLHCTATQEHVETAIPDSGFVEVGYICNVHGLQGETRVKPDTDFPELRFSEPGRRWLKQQDLGREIIREIELEEGRGHYGQKTWILKFRGIDTVEQAKQLIGSTLLVREEERPELKEGEYYSRDLVGMSVLLKETGEAVGTVVNVFDSGGNDLLQVKLDSSHEFVDSTGKQRPAGAEVSSHLVWIPFVEAIVPIVDLKKREMHIIPPKGLLELNLRYDERSKKERRQLEWKERKKNQKHFIAVKKKLCDMEQNHVFDGLRFGEKAQRNSLADEILAVNSRLLQQALKSIEKPSKRWNRNKLISSIENKLLRTLVVSEDCLGFTSSKEKLDKYAPLQKKGLQLASEGKFAIVLVTNDLVNSESSESSPFTYMQKLLSDDQGFTKIEDRKSVPLILVCASHEIEPLTTLFLENDFFSFDSEKVRFLEEEKLPVISNSPEEAKKHKILLKSPWEILKSPVGSGGVLTLLSSNDTLDNLSEHGVEYIQIMSSSHRHVRLDSLLLGFVESLEAEIGVIIDREACDFEESYSVIFSMSFMKKLMNQIEKLGFQRIQKQSSYVELIEKEWVDAIPSAGNSYELSCSIFGSLNASSYDKICVMEIAV